MKRFLLLTCLCYTLYAKADIRLPALISDHMVLQQDKEIILWGWADPGESVTVIPSWTRGTMITTTDKEGNWKVKIKTLNASKDGSYSIIFKGKNSITVNDILFGEVWLASGQSNMEFVMSRDVGWRTGDLAAAEEVPKANYPNIRMIDVPNTIATEPRTDFKGEWKICTPDNARRFSAVAFYFSKEIHNATQFPIGIINSTWGGTPAESWVSRATLETDTGFRRILDRQAENVSSFPARQKKYEDALAKWKADSINNKKPAEPLAANHNKSPNVLYNGMIVPTTPYVIKGVIWYQGESNADRAAQYRRLFPALINNWRNDRNNKDLPFYFIQIAPHYKQTPEIRDAQLFTYKTVKHTGITVITDYGDSTDIHPRNKKVVGERLSKWALRNEYGRQSEIATGPIYQSMKKKGNELIISFEFAEGLMIKSESDEFIIAGKDQQFVIAKARVEGNKLILWNDAIKDPVAARYNWKFFPHAQLYNSANMPASPFRTDSWAVPTEGKE